MKYMRIGHSELEASVLTLGAWSMGGGEWWKASGGEDKDSIETIHRALELGINLIDTAPIYGLGHSEEVVGRAIKGRRSKVLISTKTTFHWDEHAEGYFACMVDGKRVFKCMKKEAIKRDCENSLKRLGTDYIDILYTHNPARPPDMTPVEETVEALMELKKEGKIRAIGSSNVTVENVKEYLACGCEIDIIQKRYSMLDRTVEDTLLPLCEQNGISFHAYSPLEKGLLTGNVKKDFVFGEKDARADQLWWKPERMPYAIDFVHSLSDICEKYQCSYAELAIAFLRSRGDFINVICGAHRPSQIEADVPAADLILQKEDAALIRGRLAELDARFKK